MCVLRSKKLLYTLLIYTYLILGMCQSQALEDLKYNHKLSTSLQLQIDEFLEKQYKTNSSNYEVASVDLNNDGVLEYILRRKSCKRDNYECTHIIIAEKIDKILLLSKIGARKLMVDTSTSYGIKNLLVFKNINNDYNFDIYMWSPKKKMYIISEQHMKD